MKIYKAVQKLLMGDRQTGDLISLLSFLESRIKRDLKDIKRIKIEILQC
jgi:hypothetical protein